MEANEAYEKLLKSITERAIREMMSIIRANGKVATGNLLNSFRPEYKYIAEKYEADIIAADYAIFVDMGRKPGKYPPINKIKDWCRVKGIDEGLAFPIARKIFRFGIEPTPFIKPTLDKYQVIMAKELEKLTAKMLEEEVVKEIQK